MTTPQIPGSEPAAPQPSPGVSRNIQILAAVIFAALVLVVFLVVFASSDDTKPGAGADPQSPVLGVPETDALLKGIKQEGLTLGDPKAPVTIIEFIDLQCPFCAQHQNNEQPKVIKELIRTGKARLQAVPLAFLGPDSTVGRTVLLRLAEKDVAWNFINLEFLNQGAEGSGYMTDAYLRKLVAAIPGTKPEDAARTEESGLVAARTAAQNLGKALLPGGPSTPSFFIGATGSDPTGFKQIDPGSRPHAADAIIAGYEAFTKSGGGGGSGGGGSAGVTASGPRPALTVGLQNACDAAPDGASSCDAAHRRSRA